MKKVIIIVLVLLAIGLGYWLISPLFRNVKLDEAIPEPNKDGMVVDVNNFELPPSETTEKVEVVGTAGHPASGTARIVTVGGKSYLRYENFKTINGPDIFVYLAKDLEAKEFVNLGKVKATEGNVNYEIPANINPADYPYAIIWCRAFGVLFNSAKVY